jgi:hypothetical protein
MKCKICKIEYPDEILSNGICGICALELTNKIHGTNRTSFNGEMAEDLRLQAIAWRKKYKDNKSRRSKNDK